MEAEPQPVDKLAATLEKDPKEEPQSAGEAGSRAQVTAILSIKGQQFPLSGQESDCFSMFEEKEVKEGELLRFESADIDPQVVGRMLKLLKLANYSFEKYAPIHTDKLQEVIKESMAGHFAKLPLKELNRMYVASRELGCEGLRSYIVAAVACSIYFAPTLNDFNRKKDQLGIKKDLSELALAQLRQKYRIGTE